MSYKNFDLAELLLVELSFSVGANDIVVDGQVLNKKGLVLENDTSVGWLLPGFGRLYMLDYRGRGSMCRRDGFSVQNVGHFCRSVRACPVQAVIRLYTSFVLVASYGTHFVIRIAGIFQVRDNACPDAMVGVSS